VLLFTVWKGGSFDSANTWAFSTRTGKRTCSLRAPPRRVTCRRATWCSLSRYAPRRALRRKAPHHPGAATPVVEGVLSDRGPARPTLPSRNRHAGYAAGQYTVAAPDRLGRPTWRIEFLPCEPGFYGRPKLSPDGADSRSSR